MRVFLFLVFLVALVCSSDPNVHVRYTGPLYDLVLDESPPANFVAADTIEEVIDGKAYRCQVPQLPKKGEAAVADEALLESQTKTSINPEVALAPLKAIGCFYRIESWWTYEFCVGSSVKQFHQEPNTGVRTAEFLLGAFDVKESKLVVDPAAPSVVQSYVRGTMCDLTGQPRAVDVKFLCNDRPNALSYLGELTEPNTCRYSLTLFTPHICEISGKKKTKTDAPAIYCAQKAPPAAE